jgi:Ca2+-binding EF-hand superfamily protein
MLKYENTTEIAEWFKKFFGKNGKLDRADIDGILTMLGIDPTAHETGARLLIGLVNEENGTEFSYKA